MRENFEKYADLLLKKCLNLKKGQPLLIQAPIENIDFVRIVAEKAYEMGIEDIHFDFDDQILKHIQLKNLEIKDLIKSKFFDKSIFDEYAKKNAGFLMLYSDDPDLMDDIDNEKLKETSKVYRTSRPIYKQKQGTYEVPWCIACTSTLGLAKKIFPNSNDPKGELWNAIFKMCLVDKNDPIKAWDEKIKSNNQMCDLLNKFHFKTLHYTNNLGTDLKVELDYNHIWCGALEKTLEGREVLVNMPTEEVFTTPIMDKTEGVVYSSKPLVYNGSLIEDFKLTFKEGKVVDVEAKKGLEVLKNIIDADKTSNMLGEVALVNYHSPISESGIIFYETLYDENASCHLALGTGFKTCIKNAIDKKDEELEEIGINNSNIHVDFMIGTSDLQIIGTTFDGEEYIIFKDGDFVLKED